MENNKIDGIPVVEITPQNLEKLSEYTKQYVEAGSSFILAVKKEDLQYNQRMQPLLNAFHDIAIAKNKDYVVSTAEYWHYKYLVKYEAHDDFIPN